MLSNRTIIIYERIGNGLELLGVMLVLFIASIMQFYLKELPCPLCLLQRVGFLGIAFGLLLNLRFGLRPSHYGIVLISALFTSFVALRQVALHVLPGSGFYGDAVLGLHLYTWCFIISMAIVIGTVCMLSIDRQYQLAHKVKLRYSKLTHSLFVITLTIIFLNVISVFLECGFKACPDNPTNYALLIKLI